MPFRSSITTGALTYVNPADGSSRVLGFGYSGYGPAGGANDPSKVAVHEIGPTPPGEYDLEGPFHKGQKIPGLAHTAPTDYTYVLHPRPGTETFGRAGLLVHGDNSRGDRSASRGCQIQGRPAREELDTLGVELGDTLYTVMVD